MSTMTDPEPTTDARELHGADADAARILVETLRRTRGVQARERPPAWMPFAREQHDAEVRHGPRLSWVAWFAGPTNAQRNRLARSLSALEESGLVIVTRGDSGRPRYVRL